jgi:hypothetical protein
MEAKQGCRFPLVYRSLITRYIFPAFEAAELRFFANTPEGIDSHELRTRIDPDAVDSILINSLTGAGYLQFAQPAGVNYDPVCFDLNHGSDQDRPIVQIDHEHILCDGIVKVVEKIAPSFRALVEPINNAGEVSASAKSSRGACDEGSAFI